MVISLECKVDLEVGLLYLEGAGEEEEKIDSNLMIFRGPDQEDQGHNNLLSTDMDPLVVVTQGLLLNTLKPWRMNVKTGTQKMKKLIILGVIVLHWQGLISHALYLIFQIGTHPGRCLYRHLTILTSILITEYHRGMLTLHHNPLTINTTNEETQLTLSHFYQHMHKSSHLQPTNQLQPVSNNHSYILY